MLAAWVADVLQRGGSHLERLATDTTSPAEPGVHTVAPARFESALGLALAMATPERSVSVIAVRVDYFDVLTASHGADVGLEVLSIAAARLREAVRTDDVLTRFGDDGFVLLWAPQSASSDIRDMAGRITTSFDRPVETSAGQLAVTVSTGIAIATGVNSSVDARTLQRQAQTAVANAQRNGRAQLAIFDQAMHAQALESYETERHLRAALRNNSLSVDYQPIISLHSGQTVGIEALARWRDDALGFVSPATFIPIAEESGLIGELGRLILQSAIAQGSVWNRTEDADTMITVNLSNRQLLDRDLIPSVAALLDEHDLDPRRLCLEITESVVMSDVAASMTILGHMKDLGLCLAIDDFGTGYSSLSYLRRLPVDILKIDQSFVQSIYNRDDRMITKAIIDLAHTLGMTTVAEGVETHLQLEVLHALNCDMAQGYFLHMPTPPDEVNFSAVDFEALPSVDDVAFSSR